MATNGLDKPLEDLIESDLLDLELNQIPEGLRLEFKSELNLDRDKDKAEAPKDVTALANTVGGRIFYGVAENTLPDGRKVAGSIQPLTDGTLSSRLRDIISGNCQPRPRFKAHEVAVTNGFVLCLEIYPSFGHDLYMVSGFRDLRFYKRTNDATQLMSEPEIREAYSRIAASRATLEASIEAVISEELKARADAEESVIVVPCYGRPDLVDPRLFKSLAQELREGPLHNHELAFLADYLQLGGRGYLSIFPPREGDSMERHYLAIRKNGLVHYSLTPILRGPAEAPIYVLGMTAQDIAIALLIAQFVLTRASYWGPVRVIHHLNFPRAAAVHWAERTWPFTREIPAGEAIQTIYEVNLRETGNDFGPILRELLDQVCHNAGWAQCPWFENDGKLKPESERALGSVTKFFKS